MSDCSIWRLDEFLEPRKREKKRIALYIPLKGIITAKFLYNLLSV
jgi:hypothetical protein